MWSSKTMKCLILTFILSTSFSTSYAQSENINHPEVTILQGTIQGTTLTSRHNRSISAFLGIPYGEAPIGELRFANPVPAGSWTGIRNGSIEGNECPQTFRDITSGNEDCLYLNVYAPQLPSNTNSTLLPVMVFIHGGAFLVGSGTLSSVNPGYLLDKDVVLVTLNYRLGPLGFLSTGDEIASGNWGLKDMVLALKWVQGNIKFFGGNPDQVTLFGQSAGSTSTHLLSLSDASIGLFHRYITQSGSALGTWAHRPRTSYAKLAYKLGSYVGCSSNMSHCLINCLRKVNVSDILATYSHFSLWKSYPIDPWGPTDEPDVTGAILLDSPRNLYAAGKIRDLPWIVGTTRDEAGGDTQGFYQDDQSMNEFLEDFDTSVPALLSWYYQPDGGASWAKAVKSFYFNNDFTTKKTDLLANLTVMITDAHFLYPTYNALTQQYSRAVNPEYYYIFSYWGSSKTPVTDGSVTVHYVTHGDDVGYLFPSRHRLSSNTSKTMSETDYKIVDVMVELWTSFATNGISRSSSLAGNTWQRYSSLDNYLQIGNDTEAILRFESSNFKERMEFWAGLYASLDNNSTSTSNGITLTPNLLFLFLLAFLKSKIF